MALGWHLIKLTSARQAVNAYQTMRFQSCPMTITAQLVAQNQDDCVFAHTNLLSVSKYSKILLVMRMLITYKEAQKEYGSSYKVEHAIKRGELFKLSRGLYSTSRYVNPYSIISKKYPDAIITMDSAFFIHGLTDVIPDKIHLATRRNALRINDKSIRQYFLEEHLFEAGKISREYDRATINIYSLERLLVELMRNNTQMPLDYYKEIISSYRKIIDRIDIRAVEDHMSLFERNEYLFNIFQREVL